MLLIGEGTVFTRDSDQPVITRGGVLLEGSTILAVGDYKDLAEKYPDAERINARGGLIMPGLINTHHHIYSALARGLSLKDYNPHSFTDILAGLWWRIDGKLNLLDTKASAEATYISCIENGVTTIFDHHASYGQTEGSLEVIAEQARRFGVRSCLCYEISDRKGQEEMEKAVAENLHFLDTAQKDPDHLAGMIGLHASFTLSDATMQYIISRNESDAGYHVHVSEGVDDVNDCLDAYGIRPVERWNRLGILGNKTIAGHCIHINEKEMDLLKETDTIVVHNPESNMGNAVGVPDILALYKRGILLGLGTDGYTSDMLESYKVANCLVKHANRSGRVGWTEIPAMLFNNNRRIAERFFPKPVGVLKKGAYGDVIVVDYDPITPLDASNLNSHILFGMGGLNVTATISDGVVRMRDRELVGIGQNKSTLVTGIREQAADLWRRLDT